MKMEMEDKKFSFFHENSPHNGLQPDPTELTFIPLKFIEVTANWRVKNLCWTIIFC